MSGKTQTVAEHIVEFLERRDVKHVFGLCGHTNIAVLAALAESPIDFVTVRHEQIASHAADAYSRVQGRASVVSFSSLSIFAVKVHDWRGLGVKVTFARARSLRVGTLLRSARRSSCSS